MSDSSILTYRAREQIAHLSLTNHSEWDAEAISNYFPISNHGAASLLLKLSKRPHKFFRSLDDIIKYDTRSIKNWLTLIETICIAQVEEGVTADESKTLQVLCSRLPKDLRWIGLSNVLDKLAYVDGNPALPFPPQTSIEAYNFVRSRHQPGPFQKMAEKYFKPVDMTYESTCIREQQLSVINKLIPLLKCMDFSLFTQPLLENSMLTFKDVCRDWLSDKPEILEIGRSCLPKINSRVDCNFTKNIRYKWICP